MLKSTSHQTIANQRDGIRSLNPLPGTMCSALKILMCQLIPHDRPSPIPLIQKNVTQETTPVRRVAPGNKDIEL
jgi:hypothetical protein